MNETLETSTSRFFFVSPLFPYLPVLNGDISIVADPLVSIDSSTPDKPPRTVLTVVIGWKALPWPSLFNLCPKSIWAHCARATPNSSSELPAFAAIITTIEASC